MGEIALAKLVEQMAKEAALEVTPLPPTPKPPDPGGTPRLHYCALFFF